MVTLVGAVGVVDRNGVAAIVRAGQGAGADRLDGDAPRALEPWRRPRRAVGTRCSPRHVRQRRVRGAPDDGPARRAAGRRRMATADADRRTVAAPQRRRRRRCDPGPARRRARRPAPRTRRRCCVPQSSSCASCRSPVRRTSGLTRKGSRLSSSCWPRRRVAATPSWRSSAVMSSRCSGPPAGAWRCSPARRRSSVCACAPTRSSGDLAAVRHEWDTYERVITADAWSDGEPAPALVALRKQLLSP